MRNTFHEKLYTKCGGETNPGPLSKNQNAAHLRINSLKLYTVCFHCMSKLKTSKMYSNYGAERCVKSVQIRTRKKSVFGQIFTQWKTCF